eukprot:1749403-Rhodomonas_salina.8
MSVLISSASTNPSSLVPSHARVSTGHRRPSTRKTFTSSVLDIAEPSHVSTMQPVGSGTMYVSTGHSTARARYLQTLPGDLSGTARAPGGSARSLSTPHA